MTLANNTTQVGIYGCNFWWSWWSKSEPIPFRSNDYCKDHAIFHLLCLFQVADSLDLHPIPSAYQIRFRGCKGMLAIDPSLPHGDFLQILQFRKSMNKFESSHPALEICEATKPS